MTDVLLHVFLSGSHCALAELHAKLGSRVIHAPCGKVWDVVRGGLLVSLVALGGRGAGTRGRWGLWDERRVGRDGMLEGWGRAGVVAGHCTATMRRDGVICRDT